MNRLTEYHFSFKCPMRWDDMAVSANGRFCERCSKEVYDLSNCTVEEVIDLQKKHGSICGSIRVARAAAVAVSLSAAACENGATSRTTGTTVPPLPNQNADNRPSNMVPGKIRRTSTQQEVVMPGVIAPIGPEKIPNGD